jgi:very-short-patch-repair endonuclease
MDIQKVIDCYVNENMSTYQIARKFKTYPNKVRRELIKSGITIRDHSEAQAKALETGIAKHPTKGKKVNQETKEKIGESMLNSWKQMDATERKRRSDISKKNWESMSNSKIEEMRSESALAVRKASREGSKLEKYLMAGLLSMGYSASMHYLFAQKQHIDIFVSSPDDKNKGIAIEVDGPTHFKPIWGNESLHKQKKSDSKKTGLLLAGGYILIRVVTNGEDSDIRMKKTLTKIDQTIQCTKLESDKNYFEIFTEEF